MLLLSLLPSKQSCNREVFAANFIANNVIFHLIHEKMYLTNFSKLSTKLHCFKVLFFLMFLQVLLSEISMITQKKLTPNFTMLQSTVQLRGATVRILRQASGRQHRVSHYVTSRCVVLRVRHLNSERQQHFNFSKASFCKHYR